MGELAPERAILTDVVRRLRLSPVLFELGARPHPPRALYRAYLEQSHIFVGLYWERYGWISPDMRISGLEDEYRLCGDQPRLLYVKEPAPNREPRLTALLEEMQAGTTPPKIFTTREELAELVANDLALLLSARFSSARHRDAPPATSAAVAAPVPTVRQAIPLPPTPLVGRAVELAEASELLTRSDVRLVTLSGPGGIGKTRLAVEMGTRLAGEFAGGVVYTRLASITDPDLLLPTIAAAAGVQTEGSRPVLEVLVEEFLPKPTLLVLDNFEHMLGAAPALSELLRACPELTVLVTSRAVLRLHGEWEYPVRPLPEADAVELFTERAEDARAGAALHGADVEAVGELVRRLDGLPLAIELAASRTRLLPPAMLLRRLGNRLDLLTGGAADLPLRQQTLRGTIDWSYDLLEPQEQLLFARLSVFAGGWSLESAEAVCGDDRVPDVLGTLSTLLERSLVTVAEGNADGPRFRMLEVMREYARERLAGCDPDGGTEDRHTTWLIELARTAEPHLRDARAREWGARLAEEMLSFRAAVERLIDCGELTTAVDLIWALSIHLWTSDHITEARRWLGAILACAAVLPRRQRARLHFMLGSMAHEQGDYEQARAFIAKALDGFSQTHDVREHASCLTMLGAILPHFGELANAKLKLDEAVAMLREIDEPWSLAFALNTMTALVARRNVNAATVYAAEALDIAERLDNPALATQALVGLGYMSLVRGEVATARALLERGAALARNLRFREGMATCLDAIAAVALAENDPERAATALGGSDALRESIGSHIWPLLKMERDIVVASVREALGDEHYRRGWERGRSLRHTELLAAALQAPPVAALAGR